MTVRCEVLHITRTSSLKRGPSYLEVSTNPFSRPEDDESVDVLWIAYCIHNVTRLSNQLHHQKL